MARFRGTVKGQRGEASRLGGPTSGIHATINGWNFGIEVRGYVDGNDKDTFSIHLTGGSNRQRPRALLAIVDETGFTHIIKDPR